MYDQSPLPSSFPLKQDIVALVEDLRSLIFPEYFPFRTRKKCYPNALHKIQSSFRKKLVRVIAQGISFGNHEDSCKWRHFRKEAVILSDQLMEKIPQAQALLRDDVTAAFQGDPAASSHTEVILAYPSIFSLIIYRISHELLLLEVPLVPRMLSEYAHSQTGIDIHPGARIGRHFFIDHGTGVVIGETAEIGSNVRIYQGVTLGAMSVPSRNITGKRHPTIENNVIIYAEATILGGDTVIGHDSIIGGNMWITFSVPPESKLYRPRMIKKTENEKSAR